MSNPTIRLDVSVRDEPCFIDVCNWIDAIPLDEWPQQHRLHPDQLRPAMVNDEAWHGFGEVTDPLVAFIMRLFPGSHFERNRMLSVVMPRDSIYAHRDEQPLDWVTRVHVPLFTNPRATTKVDGEEVHMEFGSVHLLDTRRQHSVRNAGHTPRVHLMFDVAIA